METVAVKQDTVRNDREPAVQPNTPNPDVADSAHQQAVTDARIRFLASAFRS